MTDTKMSRGFAGAVLKLLRAGDYELTVTGRTEVSPHYLRLSFQAGGLLRDRALHPTMWIRMWFTDGEKLHQRGYTLVNPDPVGDTVDVEFALHDGVASRWAQQARPGDTIEVTVLGSNFALPEPRPAGYVIVGDTASLPAVNSLLDAIGDAPARIFLEAAHDDDKQLLVRRTADVTWVDRKNAGEALVSAVASAAFDAADHFGWVACDNRTTRAVAKLLREDYKIPRKSVKAQAYWVA
ncbi:MULTISPECIES: siderophore-interacting protein [Mycolicibacterium]|jgi:NADPH-dependent ferric siderophore reductase|uniref:FAD-binding 9, siderophore-interacting domain protein n=1 Tax=Mycolicibacterium vanbaalenii (strain DSM 7251 / JCM 13017 / BCRC 16820 / KCTC 9966 / NRRL B-24157 / PYR-1) TaxID=350058 RepID=A1TDJ3_MYCVP|nr:MULTISPECIES: siderophore-interacting protein [Mycolicibacterium]ABM15243.1 FAD-binding 9, siderophore-interacting domain protein [Mycolicibacterium vanbaalenii PYR-1]MCV7128065.1 siderophore-interacting protein [Mycolicibacterium vanbaalenii PYR-1]PQP48294.1 siderophore-interacting protein [Mycolicibacterium austroafricanum]UJL28603.1 siderophore-interacting protein [Mycolicibacterium vanbaalenii]WND55303.1 siderophore-interacting protein [Mycolicibacterium vanbaalenii]